MSDESEERPDAAGGSEGPRSSSSEPSGPDAEAPAAEAEPEATPGGSGEPPQESAAPAADTAEQKATGAEPGAGTEAETAPAGEQEAPVEPSEEEKAAAAAKATAEKEAKAKAAAQAKAAVEAKAAAEAAKPAWEKMPETPAVEDAAADPLVAALGERHGAAVGAATLRAGELAIEIDRAALRGVATSLKEEHGYKLIVDLCGVHFPDREEAPFEVVYHLYSLEANRRVRLKVRAAEGEEVPSVVPVWKGADWLEREAYDMYGIRFADHPDMTRILLWEGFNGFPLRKDFPVEGIDTGAAIYPEYYDEAAGPVAGTGTGWKPAEPPEPPAEPSPEAPAPNGETAGEAAGEAAPGSAE